jgi:hypothetical protein
MSIDTGRLAFGLAGRVAHQGCSSFCCTGTGEGIAAELSLASVIAAVATAPVLMNSRRLILDPCDLSSGLFIFASEKTICDAAEMSPGV